MPTLLLEVWGVFLKKKAIGTSVTGKFNTIARAKHQWQLLNLNQSLTKEKKKNVFAKW